MTDKLQYEEEIFQRLNDIPLPGEEAAWQKMKLLLDEKEEDKVIPFLWWKGCLGGLLLLGLGAALWFLFHDNFFYKIDIKIKNESKTYQPSKMNNKGKIDSNKKDSSVFIFPSKKNKLGKENKIISLEADNTTHKKSGKLKKISAYFNSKRRATNNPESTINNASQINSTLLAHDFKEIKNTGTSHILKPYTHKNIDTIVTSVIDKIKANSVEDSIHVKDHKTNKKEKRSTKAAFYFTAGIGLQQLIPVNGQKAVPFNYYGRKGSLLDYIPSAYVSFHKNKKWFVSAGFRYGAPQLTKEFTYTDSTSISSGVSGTKRYLTLKKTYYHQLPVSFNYLITPDWSIGTGLQVGRFFSAVSREDIKHGNPGRDTLVSSKVIRTASKTDSLFSKLQFNILWQTQYTRKNISLGIQYTKDLIPYIRYTANGIAQQKKNQNLQVFIKYLLWRSKNKG